MVGKHGRVDVRVYGQWRGAVERVVKNDKSFRGVLYRGAPLSIKATAKAQLCKPETVPVGGHTTWRLLRIKHRDRSLGNFRLKCISPCSDKP